MTTYDAAIIGLGAMGSAAAWMLARRGVSVIGFDQFRPPHNLGSSHGESRVIREAYYEDPSYVPLVQRAYELWGELGAATDQTLLRETGALMVSEADGLLVAGALASARQHGIPHEALTATEIRQRFPAMAAQEPMVGLLEHRAALMPVAECVEAQLELAARHGAELRFDTPIERWTPTDLDDVEAPIEIATADGTITADRLIITAGAWTSSLLRKLELPLLVSRQVAFWMQPKGDASRFEVGRMPIVMWERGPQDFGYAMPNLGAGVKVGYHYPGAAVDPSNYDRVVNAGTRRTFASGWRDRCPMRRARCCSPRPACTRTRPTRTSCSTCIRSGRTSSSPAPARGTGSSLRRRSASRSPTWRWSDARITTCTCSASSGCGPAHGRRRGVLSAMPAQRVAVIGAGAVGGYFGARLAEAGHDVRFLMRRDYEAVRAGGLHLTSPLGDLHLPAPTVARTAEELAEHGPVDWLLVALKATGLADLPALAAPLLAPQTRVITVLNGLTIEQEVAELLPGRELFGGMGFIGVHRGEPGQILHLEFGALNLGHHGDDAQQLADAVALFAGSKVEIRPEPCLLKARWEKLGWNIPFNGLCVVAGGVATDVVIADPAMRATAARTIEEVGAAGNADLEAAGESARIDVAGLRDRYISQTAGMGPYKPSTTIDFIEGRQMEVEAIFEVPARRASELGVAVPTMDLIASVVRVLDGRRVGESGGR